MMRVNMRLVERYRLVERIGTGGMSTVWRGYDEVLRRQVAVKVLNPDDLCDAEVRARVYREAQTAALLTHPHIVSVFDYGESIMPPDKVVPFVVMEYVPGRSLASVLAEGPLPWSQAATICAQVASALASAHERGVVHRDVKPANVIIAGSGAKVVDFGISALVGDREREADGQLLGTPAYVAPERLLGSRTGTPSDVYALGLLLYRMLSGELPWEADTVTRMLMAHQYIEPRPLPEHLWVPREVRELCQRCLAKDPQDRPSSHEVAVLMTHAAGTASLVASQYETSAGEDEAATANLSDADTWQHPPRLEPVVSGRRRFHVGRRFIAALTAASVLSLLGGFLAWGGQTAPLYGLSGAVDTPPDRCAVRYMVDPMRDDHFGVSITVTNLGVRALAEPTLQFTLPGDQTVRTSHSMGLTARAVSLPLTDNGQALPAGGSVNVRLDGTSQGENPFPTVFHVGATRCEASVGATMTQTSSSLPPAPNPPVPPDKKQKKGRPSLAAKLPPAHKSHPAPRKS